MSENIINEQEVKEQLNDKEKIQELENELETMKENVSELFKENRDAQRWRINLERVIGKDIGELRLHIKSLEKKVRWFETLNMKKNEEVLVKKEKRNTILAFIIACIILGLAMVGLGTLVSMIWR